MEPVDETENAAPVTITVEVAYAEAQHQFLEQVRLPLGSDVADAIAASDIDKAFPKVDVDATRVGIFSRKVSLTEPLSDGDRVEIYRPLIVDPKEVRRVKAAADAEKT